MRDEAVDRKQLTRWTQVLCALFFLSGFPALIYQLAWQRALFRILGVNIESVTIVVTAFMIGLGLGSLGGGWLSKCDGIPLLPLLAVIELSTGAFGLVSLRLFDRVGTWALGMPLPLTAAVALALVIVPTLLMGATLPVLIGHLVTRSGNVGSSVGLLYYVNTLGAGVACLAAAAFIFPSLGLQRAIYVAVALNGIVAVGALMAHLRDPRGLAPLREEPVHVAANSPLLSFIPVLGLACLGGFVSLSYEIFFVRTMSYASGGSAPAFALTLGAFLAGLASGSRRAGRACSAPGNTAVRRTGENLAAANIVGFLFLPLVGYFARPLGPAIICLALFLIYLLARFWGTLLPCLAHFGIGADRRAGMRTGFLYLANIIGSATGSILTGFVLMDHIGLVHIASLLVVAGLACATLLTVALPIGRRARLTRAGWAVAAASLAVVLTPIFAANTLENLMWKGAPEASPPFARIVENRSGIITVDRSGTVYGNGMYDGRFHTDLVHDTNGILRPYALSLLHPAPREVLMIGLSSGSWAQVIANNPEVASLTVVEINPGYIPLIARMPQVASVLSNPKVKIVTDDGRRWLRVNPARFDVVVSNTTWNFREHVTNLLSVEFLELIREHLKPGGIFFYNTTDSERVQRTGCLVYPYGARFTNHLVVSMQPIAWDFERWRHVLEAYRIDGRPVIDPARAEDRARLAQLMAFKVELTARNPSGARRVIEPCPGILARTAGEEPVTDDNMGTEWQRFGLSPAGKNIQ